MSGVDIAHGRGRRSISADLNMIPFVDLLMVTVAFLLITAVWTTHQSLAANALVPGNGEIIETGTTKTLHVFDYPDHFVVSWRDGSTVINQVEVPKSAITDDSPRQLDLEREIGRQWREVGVHQNPQDRAIDRAVFHCDNHASFKEMTAVLDAVYATKRSVQGADGSHWIPAFDVTFSVN